jgi:hypothetical protein
LTYIFIFTFHLRAALEMFSVKLGLPPRFASHTVGLGSAADVPFFDSVSHCDQENAATSWRSVRVDGCGHGH